ncbi:MAG: hypothetical protein Q7K11_00330 [Candidatus Berkelbacteria bacterium]|nr:hypothetical protein [Candidatus Berkelbacteria bacterium]
MTKEFTDGVCEECGNTGLAGEKCLVCGGLLAKVASSLDDPILTQDDDLPRTQNEPEIYPLELVEEEEAKGNLDDSTI